MDNASTSMAAPSSSETFRILTFNCWGLKYVAAHRRTRILAIADYIARSSSSVRKQDSRTSDSSDLSGELGQSKPLRPPGGGGVSLPTLGGRGDAVAVDVGGGLGVDHAGYDVVCLQECWVEEDVDIIRSRAKEAGLIYSKHFLTGALGSGLVILSRHPIISTSLHPYRLNGHPLHVIEGDFFVGKAVGGIKIRLPSGSIAEVFNTHFYAPGGEGPEEWRRAHRLAQVWELSQIVRDAADRGSAVFLCGDLNSVPESVPLRLLLSSAALHDAWPLVHPPPPSTASSSRTSTSNIIPLPDHNYSAAECIDKLGITCDSPLNSWSAGKHLNPYATRNNGKRLDYCLFRPANNSLAQPLQHHTSATNGSVSENTVPIPIQAEIQLANRVPDQPFSYSDHFGLSTTFTFASTTDSLAPLLAPCSSLLATVSSALALSQTHAQLTAAFHLRLFLAAIVLAVALAVAGSFQPLSWLNWIFVLAAVATGAGGATMLYVGFVGGRWEVRSLRGLREEVERELERVKAWEQGRARA